MKRAALLAALVTALILLTTQALAYGAQLGSDPFRDLTGTEADGLMGRYPLSNYTLDTYIEDNDVLGVPVPGDATMEKAAAGVATALVSGTLFVVKLVISFLVLAFDMNLLEKGGISDPIRQATTHLQDSVLGSTLMTLGLLVLAGYVGKVGLLDRRHSQAGATLLRSLGYMLVAFALLLNYNATIGWTADLAHKATTAILVGANNSGDISDPKAAKNRISGQLWAANGFRPWVAAEFGGLRHCVDGSKRDKAGYPKPVAPDDPDRTACRDHIKPVNGMGGYALRFLSLAPGSKAREREFTALRDGEIPEDGGTGGPSGNLGGQIGLTQPTDAHQFDGYHVDKTDSPAADAMQRGGGYNRLLMALGIMFMSAGFVLVYGSLAIGLILAGAGALLFLAVTPVALVAACIPGVGHRAFEWWLPKLFGFIVVQVFYAIIVTVLITMSIAFTAAIDTQGWGIAFVLQGVALIVLWAKRKSIGGLMQRDQHHVEQTLKTRTEQAIGLGAAAVTGPVAFARTMATDKRDSHKDQTVESAPTGPDPASGTRSAPSRLPAPEEPLTVEPTLGPTGDGQAVGSATGDLEPRNLRPTSPRPPVTEPQTVESVPGSEPVGAVRTADTHLESHPAPSRPSVPASPEGQEAQHANLPLANGKPHQPPEPEFPGLGTSESVVSPQRRVPQAEDLRPPPEYKGP